MFGIKKFKTLNLKIIIMKLIVIVQFYGLLVAPIYFIIRGIWIHAILSLILSAFTLGLSGLIYGLFTFSILKKYYLKKG